MHVAFLIVVFILRNSGCSFDRLVIEMEPVAAVYAMEVAESDEFARSVHYVIQADSVKCVRISGDKSLFHERLVAGLQPYIPPAVISDSLNTYKCNTSIVVAEDAEGLWYTVTTQPLWSGARFYCLVNNATLDTIRDMFKDTSEIFKDAAVAIFVVNQYKIGLQVVPPNRTMEELHVPTEGYWRVQETHSQTEIRFTIGNCDIHGTVNGNVSGLDPYKPGNFGGTDWVVFSKIAEIMNWKMKYVHTTAEMFLGDFNGTWEGGMLGGLVDNTVDVALCGIWIDWRKLNNGVQMSVPMAKVCIQYIVPRPMVSNENKPVANCFRPSVWLLTFTTLVVTCVTLNTMSLSDKYFVPSSEIGFRSWKYCFMVVWGMLFQGNYPPQSSELGSLRRIILLWAILSMLISCSFSSQLVSNFSHPKYTSKPRNVKDLVEFGFEQPYYGSDVFPWSGVFNPKDPYAREWLKRAVAVPEFEDFVERLRTKPKQAVIGSMYDKYIFNPGSKLPKPLPPEVFPGYETMDDCVRTIYEGFAVRQGSRFYQKINKYLTYFKQYGMLKKIYGDAVEELAKKQPGLRNLTARASYRLKALAYSQLSGIFSVLRIGLAVSFFAFLCEIAVHRKRKYKQKTSSLTYN